MVEHRTENSGVGGSIPFIGSIHTYLYRNIVDKNFLFFWKKYVSLLDAQLSLKFSLFVFILYKKIVNKYTWPNPYFLSVNLVNNKKHFFSDPYNFTKNEPWWYKFILKKNLNLTRYKAISTRFWFFLYLQLYIQSFTGYKFSWFFVDFNKTIKNSFFLMWWHRLNSRKLFKKFFCKKKSFYYNILNILFFKKIDRLVTIVGGVMSLTSIKKHKRYFYHVKSILKTVFSTLKQRGRLLGYSLFFRGKLGRKGSVKKSTFFYKFGRVSNSNKSIKLNYKKFIIHTETGVVGCGVNLYFNRMFTYALLYTIIYTQLLLLIFTFLTLYVNFNNIQEYTLSTIVAFTINYSQHANHFILLFLLLSGLPPVAFFLIKLSFLIKLFSTLSLFIQFLFFINFLLSMLFYLQIFNITVKNFTQTTLLLRLKNENHSILSNLHLETQKTFYNFWFFYVLFICFNLLSIFFFFDFYIIFFSFFN